MATKNSANSNQIKERAVLGRHIGLKEVGGEHIQPIAIDGTHVAPKSIKDSHLDIDWAEKSSMVLRSKLIVDYVQSMKATVSTTTTPVTPFISAPVATSDSEKGVVVDSGKNLVMLRKASDVTEPLHDKDGEEIKARITHDGTDFMLQFFTIKKGIEVPYSFASPTDIVFQYPQRFDLESVSEMFGANEKFVDYGVDTTVRFDVTQLVGDIFDDTYILNADGLPIRAVPLETRIDNNITSIQAQATLINGTIDGLFQLEKKADRLATSISELGIAIDSNALSIIEHATKLDKQSLSIDEHTTKLNEHTAKLNEHTTKLDKQLLSIDEHATKLDKHTAKIEGHATKIDEHTAKIDEHTAKLDEHTTGLDEHELVIEEIRLVLDNHVDLIDANNTKIGQNRYDLDIQSTQIVELFTRFGNNRVETDTSILSLKTTLDNTNETMNTLEGVLVLASEEIVALQTRTDEIADYVDELSNRPHLSPYRINKLFTDDEIVGDVTEYVLETTPAVAPSSGEYDIYVNGILRFPGVDYTETLEGNNVTAIQMTSYSFVAGDRIQVHWFA